MTDDERSLIDGVRSADLDDVGAPGYRAAVVVSLDGTTNLVLAHRDSIGKPVGYDPTCADAAHEKTGPLPLELVRRITISRRKGAS